MTAAAQRICLGVTTYMMLDGQPQMVLSGSVIDLPAGAKISLSCQQPGFVEAPGQLLEHGRATPVRNVRVR